MDIQINVQGFSDLAMRASPEAPQRKHVVIIRTPASTALLERQPTGQE